MDCPLVSVVFPIYNVEEWVEESLESVVRQTYKNIEVIIIDDGSTDDSALICREFAYNDSRIRIITQTNSGLSAARNAGIDSAKGDFLLFVDSDDVLQEQHIEVLVNALIDNNAEIAITTMVPFRGVYQPQPVLPRLDILTTESAIEEMFYQGVFDSCAQAKLAKKSLWEDVRFPVGYLHEDLPTTYKLFLKASKVVFVNSDTYGYRFNQSGINHAVTTDKKVETLELLDQAFDYFSLKNENLLPPCRCLRLSYCFHLLLNATESSISTSNRKLLYKRILCDRKAVLLDRKARKKTRLASLISYFGWNALFYVFKLVNK